MLLLFGCALYEHSLNLYTNTSTLITFSAPARDRPETLQNPPDHNSPAACPTECPNNSIAANTTVRSTAITTLQTMEKRPTARDSYPGNRSFS